MTVFTYINAALLGIVEGLTEFLPVSSTGHLILVGDLLGFNGPPGHVFEIIIQLAAILAVVWIYRVKLWRTAMGMFHAGPEQGLAVNVVLSFLPAMVLGLLLHDIIKGVLFNPMIVAVSIGIGMIPLIAPNFKQWMPHAIHSLVESGILLASVAAVLLNLFLNGAKQDEAAIIAAAKQAEAH